MEKEHEENIWRMLFCEGEKNGKGKEEMLGEGKDFLRRRKYFASFHNLHMLCILYILAILPFFIVCILCVSCILIDMGCVKSRRVFNHCCENDIQRQSEFSKALYISTQSFMR